MPNKWNQGDMLRLTRDCELGKDGEVLHVVVTSGVYMTARTLSKPRRVVRTGRDYAYFVKIGDLPVDPRETFPEDTDIAPGNYRIEQDVKNPKPDRRMTRDWTKAPVWHAGTEFVVREQLRMGPQHLAEYTRDLPSEVATELRARNVYTVIEMAGDRHPGLHRIGPGNEEQYAALRAALVSSGESLTQFLTRIDCGIGFVRHLVESGAMTRDQVEKSWRLYSYGEPDDDSALVPANTDDATTIDEPVDECHPSPPPNDGIGGHGGYDRASLRKDD